MKTYPWQKELMASLDQRIKILRILLIVFVLLGVFFVLLFLTKGIRLYMNNKHSQGWIGTPCVIKSSTDKYWYSKEDPYGLWEDFAFVSRILRRAPISHDHYEYTYQYQYNGTNHLGNRYSISRYYEKVNKNSIPEKLDQLEEKIDDGQTITPEEIDSLTGGQFIANSRTICYVNPEDPQQAVLKLSELSILDYYLHMFPSFVFLLIYLLIPACIQKKLSADAKQLNELITG